MAVSAGFFADCLRTAQALGCGELTVGGRLLGATWWKNTIVSSISSIWTHDQKPGRPAT
jgi:hypothetical protein